MIIDGVFLLRLVFVCFGCSFDFVYLFVCLWVL